MPYWRSGPSLRLFRPNTSRAGLFWSRKKRLTALADWEFGGGGDYCQACSQSCKDCPARINAPHTYEGWQVWDLVQRLGGQLRVTGSTVIGWDMGAALQMGAALGISPLAITELLPPIEAVMVRKTNEEIEHRHG